MRELESAGCTSAHNAYFVPLRRSPSTTRIRSTLFCCVMVWLLVLWTSTSSLAVEYDVVPTNSKVGPQRCVATRVAVLSESVDDMREICRSARDTLAFVAELGMATDFDVYIEVVAQLPKPFGSDMVGYYLPAERRVLFLSYEALTSAESFLGLPIERVLYRALASHEITHAVSYRSFVQGPPSILAMEYISAVVSLATMDPERRRQLLESMPGLGFSQESEMSLTYYLLDPVRFWVNAYRHFIRPEVGAMFINAVLAGEALSGNDPDTH